MIDPLSLLKRLLGLGKKNSSHFQKELVGIKGVGEEYANRLVKLYKNREKLMKADDLELWLPDHVARKVKKHFRRK